MGSGYGAGSGLGRCLPAALGLQNHVLMVAGTGFVPLQMQDGAELVGTIRRAEPGGGAGSLISFNHTTNELGSTGCSIHYLPVKLKVPKASWAWGGLLQPCPRSLSPAGTHPAPLRDQPFTLGEPFFIFTMTSSPRPHPCPAALGPGNPPPAFYFAACQWLRCDAGLEMDEAGIVRG